MLQQQLRQRDEDLAARKAEIGELKGRVAELESLQQQQQQLLAMKDSELAAAQQRLADVRKAEAAATPALAATVAPQPAAALQATTVATTGATAQATTQATTQAAQPAEPVSSSPMPWLWGGLALLGMALLAWLLLRRPSRSAVAPRRSFDSKALAASMVAPQLQDPPAASVAIEPPQEASPPVAMDRAAVDWAAMDQAAVVPVQAADDVVIDPDQVPLGSAPRTETPTWHSGSWVKAVPEPALAPVVTPPAPSFALPDEPAAPAPQASAAQRLKLALAFLDIGDDPSAKQLLLELLDDADPAARTEAARLLRDLG